MTYLCVVEFEKGEFEVLEPLDVCVPDQEVSVLLSPTLLKRPVLTTLDTSTLHYPEKHNTNHSLLIPLVRRCLLYHPCL